MSYHLCKPILPVVLSAVWPLKLKTNWKNIRNYKKGKGENCISSLHYFLPLCLIVLSVAVLR